MCQNGNGNGKLTYKQRKFVDELFETNFNGTEAARRAGYNGGYYALAAAASRLLKNVKVLRQVELRFKAHGITANEVLWRIHDLATVNQDDFYDIEDDGRAYLNLKKAEERGKLHQIKRIWHNSKGGQEIELHDAKDAMKTLAQMMGMIESRLRVIQEREEKSIERFVCQDPA